MKRPETKMRVAGSPNLRARKERTLQVGKPKLTIQDKSADQTKTTSNYTVSSTFAGGPAAPAPKKVTTEQKSIHRAAPRAPVVAPPSPNEEKKVKERMKANKEVKVGRKRKSLEKEVDKRTTKTSPSPSPGTIRNRKKSQQQSSGNTTSSEGKTEEGGARQNSKSRKRKMPSDPSLQREREKSSENPSNPKSSNSKEPSEEERELKQKVNKNLVRKFVKEMQERRQIASRRVSTEDMMPETSQLTMSVRAMKKKMKKKNSVMQKPSAENTSTDLTELFKPDGEPVWVVYELPPGSGELTEDGTEIRNPVLAAALADDNMELDDKTAWADVVGQLLEEKIKPGKVLERDGQLSLDPYAEVEELKNHDEYLTTETMNYLTAKGLYDMSLAAVHRFDRKRNGEGDDEAPRQQPNRASAERVRAPRGLKGSGEELKTCYEVNVEFDLTRNNYYVYERCDILKQRSKRKPREVRKMELPSMETIDEPTGSKES